MLRLASSKNGINPIITWMCFEYFFNTPMYIIDPHLVYVSRPQRHRVTNPVAVGLVHVTPQSVGDPEPLNLSATYFKCRSECHKCQPLCYRLCLHVSSLALDAKADTLQTIQSLRVTKLTASNAKENRKTSYPCDWIHLSPFLQFHHCLCPFYFFWLLPYYLFSCRS